MTEADHYFDRQEEPIRSVLLALRTIILQQDSELTFAWKYGMPFFCIRGKMFCYLWVHKKLKLPYLGIVEGQKIEHPRLIQEKRARMKIMLLDPGLDLPLEEIGSILRQVIDLYKKVDF